MIHWQKNACLTLNFHILFLVKFPDLVSLQMSFLFLPKLLLPLTLLHQQSISHSEQQPISPLVHIVSECRALIGQIVGVELLEEYDVISENWFGG